MSFALLQCSVAANNVRYLSNLFVGARRSIASPSQLKRCRDLTNYLISIIDKLINLVGELKRKNLISRMLFSTSETLLSNFNLIVYFLVIDNFPSSKFQLRHENQDIFSVSFSALQ